MLTAQDKLGKGTQPESHSLRAGLGVWPLLGGSGHCTRPLLCPLRTLRPAARHLSPPSPNQTLAHPDTRTQLALGWILRHLLMVGGRAVGPP